MKVDSHHHLWDRTVVPQPWITDELRAIDRDFDVDDLRSAAANHVVRTVVVQTVCESEETELLLSVADETPLIGAVVGWVDLTAANVGEELDRLQSLPAGRWLRGIRHQVQHEPDPNWLARSDVRQGLEEVASRGLAYELLTLPHQLPSSIEVARQLPELNFVLDHLSKPPIGAGTPEQMDEWERNIRSLATCANVSAKISGLVTEADWHNWSVGDLQPVVDVALDSFGPSRLLFGSDWPVCLLAVSYDQVVTLTGELLERLSESEARRVYSDNATDLYRISL